MSYTVNKVFSSPENNRNSQ